MWYGTQALKGFKNNPNSWKSQTVGYNASVGNFLWKKTNSWADKACYHGKNLSSKGRRGNGCTPFEPGTKKNQKTCAQLKTTPENQDQSTYMIKWLQCKSAIALPLLVLQHPLYIFIVFLILWQCIGCLAFSHKDDKIWRNPVPDANIRNSSSIGNKIEKQVGCYLGWNSQIIKLTDNILFIVYSWRTEGNSQVSLFRFVSWHRTLML